VGADVVWAVGGGGVAVWAVAEVKVGVACVGLEADGALVVVGGDAAGDLVVAVSGGELGGTHEVAAEEKKEVGNGNKGGKARWP